MSTERSPPSAAEPNAKFTLAAFAVGLVVGLALVAPVLPPLVESLDLGPNALGPVGSMLVGSVLLLVLFATGLWALYTTLVLADMR